jgi:hypothetical protein
MVHGGGGGGGGGEVVKNNFLRKTFFGTKGTKNLQVFNHLNLAALVKASPVWKFVLRDDIRRAILMLYIYLLLISGALHFQTFGMC